MPTKHEIQAATIDKYAKKAKELLIQPILDDEGKFIKNRKKRGEAFAGMAESGRTIFEGSLPKKQAGFLSDEAADSIMRYVQVYESLPSDQMLASAVQAIENSLVLDVEKEMPESLPKQITEQILEAAETMDTEKGIMIRERRIALIFPIMMQMAMNNIVSWIPGQHNSVELFKFQQRANSTFGDFTKGDEINPTTFGYKQYTTFNQLYALPDGDGTEVGGDASATANFFKFDSNTVFYGGVGSDTQPFKRRSIKLYYNNNPIASDDGNGNLYGKFKLSDGATECTVTAVIDYENGSVDPTFSVAPENGSRIHIGIDIDIEDRPDLIPSVALSEISTTLYPHQSAVSSSQSIQSYFTTQREYNFDQRAKLLRHIANLLSAEKSRLYLNRYRFFTYDTVEWNRTVPVGWGRKQDHYEGLREKCLEADYIISERTEGASGLRGFIMDKSSGIIAQSLPFPLWKKAPVSAKNKFEMHYAGKLFEEYDVYIDPQAPTEWESVAYGKSDELGRGAFYAGVCIPPTTFNLPVLNDLKYSNILWSQDYCDVNGFMGDDGIADGRKYLLNFKMTS